MTKKTTPYSTKRSLFIKLTLMAWICFAGVQTVLSQGWQQNFGFETYFGDVAEEQGHAIVHTADRGFLLIGFGEDFVGSGGDNDLDIFAVRTDVDGTLLWQKYLDKGFIEHGYDAIQDSDGNFVIVGDIKEFPGSASDFQACLMKIDGDGNEIWFQTYGESGTDRGIALIQTSDGGLLFTGRTDNGDTTDDDIYLVKTDGDGNALWTTSFSNVGSDDANSVLELADGYLITGTVENPANNSKDIYVLKTDFFGNEMWSKFFGTADFDEGYDAILTDDNQIAIIGNYGSNSDVALLKLDLDGNEIWTFTFGNDLGDKGFDLLQNKDNEFIITGITEVSASNIDILLANVSEDGQTLNWMNNLGRSSHVDWSQAVVETATGGYAIVGYNAQNVLLFNDLTLIRTHGSGDIYANKIQGKVFVDDGNCDFDTGEQGLENWIVRATSDDVTFFGATDAAGNYSILADTGEYELSIFVRNNYWMPCVDAYDLALTTNYDTLTRNFPMEVAVECELLEVSVSTAVVQNCSNVGYQVTYCNDGTISADSAWLELILDEDMTFNSASLPLESQTDSLFTFLLDTLQIGECDTLSISVATECDNPENISYTLQAHIYPDTLCTPITNWDESSIAVNGYCDADSVRFEIFNDGSGDMTEPLNFIVIEDVIMQLEESYQLPASASEERSFPANGSTYRLIAQQSLNHPGNSYPTVVVEGCDNGTGEISTGNVTIFQEDENNTQLSVDVQEATESITNLSLRGYPKGYPKDGENLIPANTALEYHILFQNTGLDTVKNVVIRDTISQTLDISTVRPGASSHEYDFTVYENGILKFTFNDLNLTPDGTEDGYGFVTFKINQKPNNPAGTEIKNTAEIFMGYNAPLETATTTHHIEGFEIRDFIVTNIENVFLPNVSIKAYPNPFIEGAAIEIEGKNYNKLTLKVFDPTGRQVREETSSGHKIEFSRNHLLSGIYFFQLHGDGEWIAAGKLMVQ